MLYRFGRTTAVAGHLDHPCGGRLHEHDAEPLLLQASPAGPARHGEHVAGPIEPGQEFFRNTAQQAYRRVGGCHQALEAPPITPRSGDGDHQVGLPSTEACRGPDQRVHALAGDQPADADHQRRIHRKPQVGTDRGPFPGIQGTEAVGVNPGGYHHRGQVAIGGARGLHGRIVAGTDHQRGPAEDPRQQRTTDREPTGHRDLGTVQDHGVGTVHAGRGVPDREGGIPYHQLGIVSGRQPSDPTGHAPRGQQHRLPGATQREGLVGVEGDRPGVRRGVDGDVVRGEASPELPQVGLDAPDLRRKVVGHQQVSPHGPTLPLITAISSATSGSPSSSRSPRRS